MWAPGSSLSRLQCAAARPGGRSASAAGFTLVELLLVVALVAMASAGVAFALRDSSQTQLEREAQRLIALLEAARGQSRATGLPVYWRGSARGFEFVGLPQPMAPEGATLGAETGPAAPRPWLAEGVTVAEGEVITLGPEPIIERQHIVLAQGQASLRIATDGLRGFAVEAEPDGIAGSP